MVDDYVEKNLKSNQDAGKIQDLINKNHMLYASLIKLSQQDLIYPDQKKKKTSQTYKNYQETISRLNEKIMNLKKTYPSKMSKDSSQSSLEELNRKISIGKIVIDKEIKMMQIEKEE